MFHPNINTQKTTAFQKNCGFSVPLYIKGFETFTKPRDTKMILYMAFPHYFHSRENLSRLNT